MASAVASVRWGGGGEGGGGDECGIRSGGGLAVGGGGGRPRRWERRPERPESACVFIFFLLEQAQNKQKIFSFCAERELLRAVIFCLARRSRERERFSNICLVRVHTPRWR